MRYKDKDLDLDSVELLLYIYSALKHNGRNNTPNKLQKQSTR